MKRSLSLNVANVRVVKRSDDDDDDCDGPWKFLKRTDSESEESGQSKDGEASTCD